MSAEKARTSVGARRVAHAFMNELDDVHVGEQREVARLAQALVREMLADRRAKEERLKGGRKLPPRPA